MFRSSGNVAIGSWPQFGLVVAWRNHLEIDFAVSPDRRALVAPGRASAKSPLKIRDVDGKAWIVSARTSIVTWALIATTHSWMAADASGQAIAAPTSSRRGPVDHDRHVPELGLEGVAPRALREVGDELEGVEPGVERLVERLSPTDDASGSV